MVREIKKTREIKRSLILKSNFDDLFLIFKITLLSLLMTPNLHTRIWFIWIWSIWSDTKTNISLQTYNYNLMNKSEYSKSTGLKMYALMRCLLSHTPLCSSFGVCSYFSLSFHICVGCKIIHDNLYFTLRVFRAPVFVGLVVWWLL